MALRNHGDIEKIVRVHVEPYRAPVQDLSIKVKPKEIQSFKLAVDRGPPRVVEILNFL